MTIKSLEHYENLSDKAVASLGGLTPIFLKSSIVGKIPSNSTACYREIIHKWKSPPMWQTSLLPYFKKLPPSLYPLEITTLIIQQQSTLRHDPLSAKRPQIAEGSDDG